MRHVRLIVKSVLGRCTGGISPDREPVREHRGGADTAGIRGKQ